MSAFTNTNTPKVDNFCKKKRQRPPRSAAVCLVLNCLAPGSGINLTIDFVNIPPSCLSSARSTLLFLHHLLLQPNLFDLHPKHLHEKPECLSPLGIKERKI